MSRSALREEINDQLGFAFGNELIVDLFAGGGGASLGVEQAFGRDVDIAINHNLTAVAVHRRNHPRTAHYCEDVFAVDPRAATGGRQVGLLHASPDCTHHSQARGGQPRSKVIRALSWVVLKWAGRVRPRVITLENVEQILQWSPLVAKRDKATGRVLRLDGAVAEPGERTPIDRQFLVPDPTRRGHNWQHFVGALRTMGYAVEWRKLRACDYGAPTSRERLFMVARCDGEPIVWPKPTHGKGRGPQPYRTAADCIDWSIPCPSIFGRKKPLADATHRRIARGVKRFVLDAAQPFIVPITHSIDQRVHALHEPVRTLTTASRGELSIVAPTLVQAAHGEGKPGGAQRRGSGAHDPKAPVGTIHAGGGSFALAAPVLVPRYGERPGQEARALDAAAPAPTIVPTGNGASLAVAYLEQANTGMVGHDARSPLSTIVGKGSTQRLVAAHLQHASTSNTNGGRGTVTKPLRTILAGGTHNAVVECTLSPEAEAGALRVAAFLIRYYGLGGQHGDLRDPIHTIPTKDRLALVTVWIKGGPWVIVDIGLRMLTPEELKLAQGFPAEYVINEGEAEDGTRFRVTKTGQVRLIGNSVSPPPLRALVAANVGRLLEVERRMRA